MTQDELAPRNKLDCFIGPGATTAELVLQFGAAVVVGVGCLLVFRETQPDVSPQKNVIVALIGLDMAGGIITNSTSAAKRWFHRPGQGFKEHMSFIAIHALQIATVAFQFVANEGEKWLYFGLVYFVLLVSAAIVLIVPSYLQRPTAMTLVATLIPASMSKQVPQTPGMEWFLPLLFIKLLVSHLVKETPFRPDVKAKQS
eukprot:CAMPEP_0197453530 /NCGR_PEP_ID=MMETSP1175-20131217/35213_1 /TAXON_ID=1003142 /ORGANISM="Triceratium dubium, Strain CCMP147" /LENGTH=199 /DNA_ID=CAMNT_0042986845 /DNA_START=90 /DNA_END=689 /DNA_ORIENTATION=-